MICPLCDSTNASLFARREDVPVHQHHFMATKDAAQSSPRGQIHLYVCHHCSFIFNAAFDSTLMHYSENYDNRQTFSPSFMKHVDGLVEQLVQNDLHDCIVAEVGCGKGFFISKLVERGVNVTGYGYDSSYEGPEVMLDGRLQFKRSYFNAETKPVPDAVVCRHVIEHVQNPVGDLIGPIAAALGTRGRGRVFFETPDVNWILRNGVIWDIFYEHCSYFSPQSLSFAFKKAGFSIDAIKPIFGGQYLWFEGSVSARAMPPLVDDQDETVAAAMRYGHEEKRMIGRWRDLIFELSRTGKVAVWGAGAKGVTLVNLVDPKAELVHCLIDLNPNKVGRYAPGTGHPVVSFRDLPELGVRHAVVMNPLYVEENARLLDEAGVRVNLVTPEAEWG